MPGNNYSPPVLLAAEADWRRYQGESLFLRGAVNVAGSATAPVYEDLVHALTGYTSQAGRSLTDDASAGWTGGASVITCGLDRNDRVYFHSTAVAFTLQDQTGAFGLPTAPTASVVTGAVAPYAAGNIVLGTREWTRGAFTFGSVGNYLWITPAASAQYVTPSVVGTVSSLPILLRDNGIGDADAAQVTDCLEWWDNEVCDNAARRIRWGVNSDGLVYTTRPNGVAAAPAWVSTAFRDALGFTGQELEVASGTLRTLTATYEPSTCILVSGLRRCHPWSREDTTTVDLRSGAIAAAYDSRVSGWEVEVYLRGPAHQAESDPVTTYDVTRQLRDRFLPACRLGAGLNVYRHWGDTRRSLARRSVTGTQYGYDLLYTSERDGARGRLRCVRDAADAAERRPAYDGMPEVRQTAGFILRDRVD